MILSGNRDHVILDSIGGNCYQLLSEESIDERAPMRQIVTLVVTHNTSSLIKGGAHLGMDVKLMCFGGEIQFVTQHCLTSNPSNSSYSLAV